MLILKTFGSAFVALLFFVLVMPYQAFAVCKKGDASVEEGRYGHALAYYEMCIDRNPDSEDLYKLATLYYKGLGNAVPDYKVARNFFSKAAERGHAPSMMLLGLMAVKGEGFDNPDNIEGYKWFLLASERPENKWIYGFDTADTVKSVEYLKKFGQDMTDEEKQKAAVLAGFYKEEVIIKQANKFFSEDELKTFTDSYAKGADERKEALENLKAKMAAESESQQN